MGTESVCECLSGGALAIGRWTDDKKKSELGSGARWELAVELRVEAFWFGAAAMVCRRR
jgi:hypothetical protein